MISTSWTVAAIARNTTDHLHLARLGAGEVDHPLPGLRHSGPRRQRRLLAGQPPFTRSRIRTGRSARRRSSAMVPSACSRPRCMMSTRSARCSSSPRAWEDEQHRRSAPAQRLHDLVEAEPERRVEPGGRLVEQQQARLAQQRLRQPQPLAHALGIGPDAPSGGLCQPDRSSSGSTATRGALETGVEAQQLAARQRGVEGDVLGQEADVAPRTESRCPAPGPAPRSCPRSGGSGPASASSG